MNFVNLLKSNREFFIYEENLLIYNEYEQVKSEKYEKSEKSYTYLYILKQKYFKFCAVCASVFPGTGFSWTDSDELTISLQWTELSLQFFYTAHWTAHKNGVKISLPLIVNYWIVRILPSLY